MEKMRKILMAEAFGRIISMVLLSITAILVNLDSETKKVFFTERKAEYKYLKALWVVAIVAPIAASYQFLQLCRCLALAWIGKNPCGCPKFWAWLFFICDQGVAYLTFATTLAAIQGALIAVTGVKALQWDKLCNIYTRFCIQAAAALLIGGLASLAMAVVSSLSAYRLFRLYRLYPSSGPSSCTKVSRWSFFKT